MPQTLGPTDVLSAVLAPPGFGIPSFSASASSGTDEWVLKQTLREMGVITPLNPSREEAEQLWRTHFLKVISTAKIIVLGAPSDTGAGIRRGAAYGPIALRETLLKDSEIYKGLLQSGTMVDAGDLRVNPHLLHDSMLSDSQIQLSQEAQYLNTPAPLRSQLPVSPLSQLERALECIQTLNPGARLLVLGGDHSIAWPITQSLHARHGDQLGILQPDAHTDLLPSRLGVKYCFGTWSWHADQLLGGNQKLVQIGIRQSGRDQAHWEKTTGVRQVWAHEFRRRTREQIAEDLLVHFRSRGVKALYLSNDIDGTDDSWASATGTPAPQGLQPEDILVILRTLCREIPLVAADLVEVAPTLAPDAKALATTLETARRFIEASLELMSPRRT